MTSFPTQIVLAFRRVGRAWGGSAAEPKSTPLHFPPQGTSTKYSPQRVGLSHIMHDEDVIQVVKK